MDKQSAFIKEERDEKIVTENEEEKKKKELKRKRNCERQRAYYHRQKEMQKYERERKKKEKVPKSNAERQRKFRQRQAEKLKRQKLAGIEENVAHCRAAGGMEDVTLQGDPFHRQLLHVPNLVEVCSPDGEGGRSPPSPPAVPLITAIRTLKRSPSDPYEETPGSPQFDPLPGPFRTEYSDSQFDRASGPTRYDEFDHFGLMIASKVRRIQDFEERETVMNVIQNIVYQSVTKRRPAELPP